MTLFRPIWLLVLLALSASAQSFSLKWDASDTPGVTNYILYGHTNALTWNSLPNAVIKMNTGTNTMVDITAKEGQYWFTVTAVVNGIQSTNSNVLPVTVPKAPATLYTLAVQYGGTVDSVTNVALFVRLRPVP